MQGLLCSWAGGLTCWAWGSSVSPKPRVGLQSQLAMLYAVSVVCVCMKWQLQRNDDFSHYRGRDRWREATGCPVSCNICFMANQNVYKVYSENSLFTYKGLGPSFSSCLFQILGKNSLPSNELICQVGAQREPLWGARKPGLVRKSWGQGHIQPHMFTQ